MTAETAYRDVDRKHRVVTPPTKYNLRPVEERAHDFAEALAYKPVTLPKRLLLRLLVVYNALSRRRVC